MTCRKVEGNSNRYHFYYELSEKSLIFPTNAAERIYLMQ